MTYFSRTGNNITAAVGAGTFRMGEGSPGDRDHVTLTVKPSRTLLRKTVVRNGKRVTIWRSANVTIPLVVSSVGDPGLTDTALFIVKHR
jgi:hypothetical protein